MERPVYQIDAFTDKTFSGNPACVVLLEEWLPDGVMLSIAAENNVPETAFVISRDDGFHIRWFAPSMEVDLCGHATLSAAFVLFEYGHAEGDELSLTYGGGQLSVACDGDLYALDFPARPMKRGIATPELVAALGATPSEIHEDRDIMAVFDKESQIQNLSPDINAILALDTFGVVVTAPGNDCDFVSRFFVPKAGIPEDHVTGSTHCSLIPYWSTRLNKKVLHARQLSKRGGELFLEDRSERVTIAGRAVEYLSGTIHIPG